MLHNHPILGIFNNFIILIAITGLVLIKVMVTSANCLSISTHWHQFTPWWLFKKRGYQGVTGNRRFTWDQFLVLRSPQLLIIRLLINSWLKFSSSEKPISRTTPKNGLLIIRCRIFNSHIFKFVKKVRDQTRKSKTL